MTSNPCFQSIFSVAHEGCLHWQQVISNFTQVEENNLKAIDFAAYGSYEI